MGIRIFRVAVVENTGRQASTLQVGMAGVGKRTSDKDKQSTEGQFVAWGSWERLHGGACLVCCWKEEELSRSRMREKHSHKGNGLEFC